jgi:hypothetical protein
VAIKMIRANETMSRAAQLEMRILKARAVVLLGGGEGWRMGGGLGVGGRWGWVCGRGRGAPRAPSRPRSAPTTTPQTPTPNDPIDPNPPPPPKKNRSWPTPTPRAASTSSACCGPLSTAATRASCSSPWWGAGAARGPRGTRSEVPCGPRAFRWPRRARRRRGRARG